MRSSKRVASPYHPVPLSPGDLAINNVFTTTVGRSGDGTLPPLARAYMILLDHPGAYWDIRAYPPVWDRLSEYETRGLGPIPAQPTARGIPEPVSAAAAVILATGVIGGRTRRIAPQASLRWSHAAWARSISGMC